MSATSYKISDGLFLVTQMLRKDANRQIIETPTNHILIIDVSGSMHGVLPRMREQIKNKMPTLARAGDTVSIIWFSGRGQFGILIENHPLDDVTDFTRFNAAVERWLRPIGLTGFVEPLKSADQIIGRVKNGFPFSMFFLTDGYDNQWRDNEILAACDSVGAHVQSATIVEYGYYCNRPLLVKMAEQMGGALIFADSFSAYEPTFEAVIKRRPMGVKKVTVEIEGLDVVGNLVWSFDGNPTVYRLADGDVAVSEGLDQINYLNRTPVGVTKDFTKTSPAVLDAYVAMAVFAQRMDPDTVLALLKATGDVRFIKQFTNCFGKQSYSTFQKDALDAALDPKLRLTSGYDPKLIPPDDAFTVLDVLALLAMDDGNRFYPLDPGFGYERIGRKTESSASRLTEAEQTEIAELTMKAKNAKELAAIQKRIAEIIASKPVELKFVQNEPNPGVGVSGLTTNATRPNISVLVRMEGTVDITPITTTSPESYAALKGVPTQFPTFIWRNFTVIADGIVNTKKLPVSLTEKSFAEFYVQGLIDGSPKNPNKIDALSAAIKYDPKTIYLIDLSHLPTVNRKMVRGASAKVLFETELASQKSKAASKVLKNALDLLGGAETSAGIEATYGREAAELLALNGIKDGGFSPKVVQSESTDTYLGKELVVKIPGLSSLPAVTKVVEAVSKLKPGKELTISNKLMADWLPAVAKIEKEFPDEKKRKVILEGMFKQQREKTREFGRILNEQKFAIVVGQVWFKEFESMEQNSLVIDGPTGPLTVTVDLKETEFKR